MSLGLSLRSVLGLPADQVSVFSCGIASRLERRASHPAGLLTDLLLPLQFEWFGERHLRGLPVHHRDLLALRALTAARRPRPAWRRPDTAS